MSKTFDLSTLNLSAGTHTITVKARASGYTDSPASDPVSYVVAGADILAPTISYNSSNANLTISDKEENGNLVVSYNLYTEETCFANVLRTGTDTVVYLPDLIDGNPYVYVRAVDNKGNLSPKSNGKSTCFVAGTPVLMADNTYKMIEQIQVGDEVKSYNFTTSAYCNGTVTKVATGYATRIAMVLLKDGSYVAMSEGHPLYTRDGWHSITNKDGYPTLVIGDEVLCQSKYVAIQDIQVVDTEPTMVYSLGVTVSNGQDSFDGTYFAGTGSSMTSITHGGGSN